MGRRSKLTEERQKKIITMLKGGVFEETAARAAGVSTSTYYAWKAKGEKQVRGKYRDFLEAVKEALAEAEAYHVMNIRTQSKKHWQASAWYLERKHPELYAKRSFEGALGKDGKPVDPPVAGKVLVVPADIEDIHEWSKQAQAEMARTQADTDERSAADVPS